MIGRVVGGGAGVVIVRVGVVIVRVGVVIGNVVVVVVVDETPVVMPTNVERQTM